VAIKIHPHAKERMHERGTSEDEAILAIEREKCFLQNSAGPGSGIISPFKATGGGKNTTQSRWKYMLYKTRKTGL